MDALKDNIKRLRMQQGLNQSDFASKLSVAQQTVSSWENGTYPEIPILCSIADFFDVTIDDLLYNPTVKLNNRKMHKEKTECELSNELIPLLDDNERNQVDLMIEFLVYRKNKKEN